MLKYLQQEFKGRRVLVTGHTGFKGSWLTFILSHLGAEVFGASLDLPESNNHAYYALRIQTLIKNERSSICDLRIMKDFKAVLEIAKPDYVFHLAAQALVSVSYVDPYRTFSTNTLATLNLLELRRLGVFDATTVLVTSDKCYKNDDLIHSFIEGDCLGGDDPYSASKAGAEVIIQSYFASFSQLFASKGAASVRAGNVFGGGDWSPNRLVPDAIRASLDGRSLEVRLPNATRPWTLVHDILVGYLLAAVGSKNNPELSNQAWNFSSADRFTVWELSTLIAQSLGAPEPLAVKMHPGSFHEVGELQLDSKKARTALNWSNRFSLTEAIRMTTDWYLAQRLGGDMQIYSMDFLNLYFDARAA